MNSPTLARLVLGLTAIILHLTALSQGLFPVSLEKKVSSSQLIVEGKVISQESFWNQNRTLIFTNNTIEIYKVLKGSITSSNVEVVTIGGSIDGVFMGASDLLELEIGKTGIFFCQNNSAGMRSPSTGKFLYDVYASSQGFLEYDLAMQVANAPFAKDQNVKDVLYPQIERLAGTRAVVRKELPVVNMQNRLFAPGIISFSPTTVNAGALLDPSSNLLTISGTDFGNPAGSAAVFFDNANDGSGGSFTGLAYNSPLIVSWSNTQIQVRVPSLAGTGVILVRDEFGATVASSDILTVNYAVITSTFSATTIKETNQMNANGSGGYTVLYSTSTSNGGIDFNSVPDAKAAFQRALNTWNEVAGWNVVEGGNTTSQAVANDGVNIVMFDNTGTGVAVLPDGVLGTCYFFSSMCLPLATNAAQLTGFDIVLRNEPISAGSADFVSGPCPPAASDFSALDLETVILHELGHAVGLAHVNFNYEGSALPQINPGLLMNFALVNGVKRTSLDNSAYSGAVYLITPQGNPYGSCGLFPSEMIPLSTTIEAKDECPGFPGTPIPGNTTVAFDLEHTTSNLFTDPQYTSFNCAGTGTGITNTAFYPFRTGNGGGGTLTLTVTDYTTIPGSLSCSPFGSYATAGIELALYQVNACPTGQAYPTPIACRVFNSNGALTSIGGLAANTNYLLVVDGRENTKASFNLVFTGTVLPVELVSFTGEPRNLTSYLKWETSSENNNSHFEIETSKDGSNYYYIGKVEGQGNSASSHQYSFIDHVPSTGINYYRLKQVDLDGNFKYSKVVTVSFNEVQRTITMYPNPAEGFINLEISKPSEKMLISILSIDGKMVRMETAGPVQRIKRISLDGIAAGTYVLRIVTGGETQFLKFVKR